MVAVSPLVPSPLEQLANRCELRCGELRFVADRDRTLEERTRLGRAPELEVGASEAGERLPQLRRLFAARGLELGDRALLERDRRGPVLRRELHLAARVERRAE